MSKALLSLAAVFSISIVRAQAGFSGPVQGFVFDPPTHTVRAVVGALGSATLGPELASFLDAAWVAPRQNYAIAVRGGEVVFLSGLGHLRPLAGQIAGISSIPEGAVWSEDGSAAVLYSQAGHWIQILTGFPDSIIPETQLTLPYGGSLSAVATDSGSKHVAIGISGDQGGVYQLSGGVFSSVLQAGAPIALAFSSDHLYVLDQASNQISGIGLVNGAVQTSASGVDDAVAIRPGIDQAKRNVLYVAGRSSRVIVSLDRASYEPISSASLSVTPSSIDPLGADGFVLAPRADSTGPLWTFTNTEQPTPFFVPATPAVSHGHGSGPR